MAYPKVSEPELTVKMDALAREKGVSILGTGINPGMIMDLLVIMLTGASMDVNSIKAERVNSLSPFGPAVMEEQGVGLSPEDSLPCGIPGSWPVMSVLMNRWG